jgi:hypothetical protein
MIVLLVLFFLVLIISISFVKGIDYMKENHPDYKGDDFIDWGIDDADNIT